VTLLDSTDETITRSLFSELTVERSALGEDAFGRMIVVERKRTERSGKPFLLMLLVLLFRPAGLLGDRQ